MNNMPFKQYCKFIENFENMLKEINEVETIEIESLFEYIEKHNLVIEEVMTSDIAQFTPPIKVINRKSPSLVMETAPPDEEIKSWMETNKLHFKKTFGGEWEKILYYTAWHNYNKKHNRV